MAVFNPSEAPAEVSLNDKRLSGTFQDFLTKENFNVGQSFQTKLDKNGVGIYF